MIWYKRKKYLCHPKNYVMAKTKEDLFQEELVKFILNWCKDNDMPPFELNGVYTGPI